MERPIYIINDTNAVFYSPEEGYRLEQLGRPTTTLATLDSTAAAVRALIGNPNIWTSHALYKTDPRNMDRRPIPITGKLVRGQDLDSEIRGFLREQSTF